MELSFDEIKRITFGWEEAVEENGRLAFYKNTAECRNAWLADNHENVYVNSKKTTGVRLDFYTDSVKFEMRTTGGGFDFMKDCLYVKSANADEDFSIDLGRGEKRITVYLRSHARTNIVYIRFSDGARFNPVKFSRKILFLGDSITEGWESRYFFASYANIVSRALDAESVVNASGGGYYLPSTVSKGRFDPDFSIVAFGTNDYDVRSCFAEVDKNVRAFFDKVFATYPNKKVFVISPIWRDLCGNEKLDMGDFSSYCERLKKVYSDYPVTVIDGFGLVPHDSRFFADEVLHPNALGFYIYAENLLRELKNNVQ